MMNLNELSLTKDAIRQINTLYTAERRMLAFHFTEDHRIFGADVPGESVTKYTGEYNPRLVLVAYQYHDGSIVIRTDTGYHWFHDVTKLKEATSDFPALTGYDYTCTECGAGAQNKGRSDEYPTLCKVCLLRALKAVH